MASTKRKIPMALDAVSPIGNWTDIYRVDRVREDGIAILSRIDEQGNLRYVTLDDGRVFPLSGVGTLPVARLFVRDDIPLVSQS